MRYFGYMIISTTTGSTFIKFPKPNQLFSDISNAQAVCDELNESIRPKGSDPAGVPPERDYFVVPVAVEILSE